MEEISLKVFFEIRLVEVLLLNDTGCPLDLRTYAFIGS